MTAHEYLGQIHELDIQIRRKQEKARKIKESLYASGISYENIGDAKPHNTGDAMGGAIAKVIDYLQEIEDDTARLIVLRIEADNIIGQLEDEAERRILEQHYLFYESIEKIAEDMGYTTRTVYRYRNSGLEKLTFPESCH
jgi:DNA-directed RNA polymerase specialized sigma24 family protein